MVIAFDLDQCRSYDVLVVKQCLICEQVFVSHFVLTALRAQSLPMCFPVAV